MTFSLARVHALFMKDLKDLSKNMFVLSTVVMPFLFAFLFGRGEDVPVQVYFLVINLTFTSIAVFVQAALLSEEKEKNTLRGLMMSPASTSEILIGKSLVSALITIVTMLICIRIVGYEPVNPVIVYSALGLGLIFFLAFGTLLGLVTRSLIETSVVIVPVILLFGMGNTFTEFFSGYEFLYVLDYLPNFQMELLAVEAAAGGGWQEAGSSMLILTGWIFAAVTAVVLVYRKQQHSA
ncbi:ABC transporter permease [Alkalicoccus halolimnae]|uniref:ABC transporter permease n=1 Tax=Alkalicoccus halolimnae TaxID=1667239 RepID=A0A5C7FBY6_9BACI|nr:ABC transporter permease [Alkalicoccus halolimnae]TXF86960.1 ABC transporter permease [Alkalicoccus halolimnae]